MLTDWLIKNWVEVAGAITGLIAIYFQIKEKVVFWPVSIINVLLYIYVYYSSRLYAEVSLQSYYLVVSFYGWYVWSIKDKAFSTHQLRITKTSFRLWIKLFAVFVISYAVMAYLLKNFTNTDVPYIDSFVTSLSFIATWMLARKKLENWLVWIVVDAVSVGVYIYKELYATIVLFTVLTVLAFIGYNQWKHKTQENE
jgi:nicotinamide mononucleotide transporter